MRRIVAYCRDCGEELLNPTAAILAQQDGCPECGSNNIEMVWNSNDWYEYDHTDHKYNTDERV